MLIENFDQALDAKKAIQLAKSKLLSQQNQLKNLLAKKIRLELEIKALRKSISRTRKNANITIRTKLQVENTLIHSTEPLPASEQDLILLKEFNLLEDIKELDLLDYEVQSLLQELDRNESK